MSQLVHQNQVRFRGQHAAHVEFREDAAAVGRLTWRDDFELPELGLSLATPVAFDPADDDALSGLGTSPALGQHAVRLANSGSRAQVGA